MSQLLSLSLLPILGFACFTAASPATRPEPSEPTREDGVATISSPSASNGAGLRVVIDPVTGDIVNNPTDSELRSLSRPIDGRADAKRRSAWELREFSLPSGGRGVVLDGWADHSLSVKVTADGRMQAVCSQGDRHGPATERPEANEQ